MRMISNEALCLIVFYFLISISSYSQTTIANTNGDCDGMDCFEFISFDVVEDAMGMAIPNYFEGVAQDNSCNTIIGAQAEYMGSDSDGPSISSGDLSANVQGTSTDTWTIVFDEPLTNPVLDINALETASFNLIKDADGVEIPLANMAIVGTSTPTYTAGQGWTDDTGYRIQLLGTYELVILEISVVDNDRYNFSFGTCLSANPPPPCNACAENTKYEYLSLANASGTGTGATADVMLDGELWGSAEVEHSDITRAIDLSGSRFGALAQGDAGGAETFVLRIDLCEAITVQQLDVLGLETESQIWVGTTLSGVGAMAIPGGLTLTACGGTNTTDMGVDGGNMVTNTNARCSNQGNGKYTVGTGEISTLYFRYTNPLAGCQFDKTTFRIGTCVPDGSDAIPACPLTYITYATDADDYATNGPDFTGADANAFQVMRDANGVYFDRDCSGIQNAVENMTAIATITISPCAELVDEEECSFCEPTPPCTMCGMNERYEYLDLRNSGNNGTADTAEVYLDGVLYGSATVLFDDLDIGSDLSGSRFGAFDNNGGTLLMRLDLCESISVQQLDILGLETESEASVGLSASTEDASAVLSGLTVTRCAGDVDMSVQMNGSTVINEASRCSNQGDANFTVVPQSTDILYFKYHNPDPSTMSCRFDKATFRIGVCVAEPEMITPMCPIELVDVTTGMNTVRYMRDKNNKYFQTTTCPTAIPTSMMTEDLISPCATVAKVEDCAVCAESNIFKSVARVEAVAPQGDFLITFDLTIENTSASPVTNLRLLDDMDDVSNLGSLFKRIESAPRITTSTATIDPTINAGYNGASVVHLLDGVSGLLLPGEYVTVQVTARIDASPILRNNLTPTMDLMNVAQSTSAPSSSMTQAGMTNGTAMPLRASFSQVAPALGGPAFVQGSVPGAPLTIELPSAIPTLGEWGIMLLLISLTIVGLVNLRQQEETILD